MAFHTIAFDLGTTLAADHARGSGTLVVDSDWRPDFAPTHDAPSLVLVALWDAVTDQLVVNDETGICRFEITGRDGGTLTAAPFGGDADRVFPLGSRLVGIIDSVHFTELQTAIRNGVALAGSGTAPTAAHSDHTHTGTYLTPTGSGASLTGITAAQVGAYTTTQVDEALAAKANTSSLGTAAAHAATDFDAAGAAATVQALIPSTTDALTEGATNKYLHLAGTGTAGTAARSDHNHTGTYQPAGSYASASHSHAEADITSLTTDLAAKASTAALTAHTGNTSNPHAVTAAQVGAATAAQGTKADSAVQSITLNTSNTLHSTPVTFTVSSGAASGTLALNTQSANVLLAGPSTGSAAVPAFRALVAADIPGLDGTKIASGTVADARLSSNVALLASSQTFTGAPTFSNGCSLPRTANLPATWIYDYQDEAAFLDKWATATVTPTPAAGPTSNLFRDDTSSVSWSPSSSPWPITIECDCSSANITNKNNGSYAIGLTFRSTGSVSTTLPTHVKIEFWDSGLPGYTTAYDQNVSITSGFAGWSSPALLAPAGSGYNLVKIRVTLSGTNPLGAGDTIRLQRLMVYHVTANWDPWHLHVGGGTVYGDITVASGSKFVGSGSALTTTAGRTNEVARSLADRLRDTFNVKDFGAKGDGTTDDYAALQAAYAALQAAGTGTLLFPPGTYLVGPYKITGGAGANGITDLTLTGLTGFRVSGHGATIKVNGSFRRTADYQSGPFWYSYRSTVIPLRLISCQQFTVEGLTLDGSTDQMTRDTNVVEDGPHGLLRTEDCHQYVVRDLRAHHGQTDGFIQGISDTAADTESLIENCRFDHNARNNCSPIQVYGSTYQRCQFDFAGVTDGAYTGHSPMAGVDIEPNVDIPAVDQRTGEITFLSCTFSGSLGGQFQCGNSGHFQGHVTLRDCTVDGGGSPAYATLCIYPQYGTGVVDGCRLQNLTQLILDTPANLASRAVVRNCLLETAANAIYATVTGPQVIVENNTIVGTHTSPLTTQLVTLYNPAAIFRFNTIFVPAAAATADTYTSAVMFHDIAQVVQNTYDTDLGSGTGKKFTIYYGTSPTTAERFKTNTIVPVANTNFDITRAYPDDVLRTNLTTYVSAPQTVYVTGGKTALLGNTDSGVGVSGQAGTSGKAVDGYATGGGTGVHGFSDTGVAGSFTAGGAGDGVWVYQAGGGIAFHGTQVGAQASNVTAAVVSFTRSVSGSVTTSGDLFFGNDAATTTGRTGALLRLQKDSVNKFVVDLNGAVTATSYAGSGASLTGITASQVGAIQSISLATSGTVHATPVTFTVTSGAASGTLTLNNQSANLVFAGPSTGSATTPTFRSLVAADIPNLDASKITTGTIADGLLSTNVPLKNASNHFTTTQYLDRAGSGSGNGVLWGFSIQNSAASDAISFGQSSSAYTTGGVVGWIGNSQAYLYYPSTFKIGTGTGSTATATFDSSGNVSFPRGTISGNGSGLTNLDPTKLSSGTAGVSITGSAGSVAASGITSVPTGLLKGAAGAIAAASAGTDYLAPSGSGASLTGITASQIGSTPTGILKGSAGAIAAASAGTDYLAPTGSGAGLTGLTASQIGSTPTGILKGSAGAIAAASAGTDYLAPSGSGASLTGITAAQVGAAATSHTHAYGDITSGYPTLTSVHAIADNSGVTVTTTPTDIGLYLTLPAAGTYLIVSSIRVNLYGDTSNNGAFTAYLYNATAGAEVSNSRRLILATMFASGSGIIQQTGSASWLLTVAGSAQIRTTCFLSVVTGSGPTGGTYSDASGYSTLDAIRIA